jgi:hypothetical protein
MLYYHRDIVFDGSNPSSIDIIWFWEIQFLTTDAERSVYMWGY